MPPVNVPQPTWREKLKRFFMIDLVQGLKLTLKYPHGAAVLTTFHPAYLLRLEDDALAKAEAAVNEDLDAVKARLAVER